MANKHLMLIAGLCLALALGGCSGMRDKLGLNKQSPDEYRVLARAPLSVPPNFNKRPLPPPEPGVARPQEGTTADQAKTAVFRIDDTGVRERPTAAAFVALTPGEQALLMAAGADQADSQIREVVNLETDRINDQNESFVEDLVFWRDPEPTGEVVDATEESRRINENVALGKGVTQGETPSVERREKALLEGIF